MQTPIEKTLRDMLDVALDNISDLSERMAARSAIANTDLNNMRSIFNIICVNYLVCQCMFLKIFFVLK